MHIEEMDMEVEWNEEMERIWFYQTKVGEIGIGEKFGAIVRVTFGRDMGGLPEEFDMTETTLLKLAAVEIQEYLDGKRKTFDLPLAPEGTPFQKQVWQALRKIPYGQTATYGEIAAAVGIPKGARAIGRANHENHIAILIPCHRVVGANGKLTGYAAGIEIKKALLTIEQGEELKIRE